MSDKGNIFISHVHEDDELLSKLTDLLKEAGVDVWDGSLAKDKLNDTGGRD